MYCQLKDSHIWPWCMFNRPQNTVEQLTTMTRLGYPGLTDGFHCDSPMWTLGLPDRLAPNRHLQGHKFFLQSPGQYTVTLGNGDTPRSLLGVNCKLCVLVGVYEIQILIVIFYTGKESLKISSCCLFLWKLLNS